jgi:hypothetical protein
MTNVKTALKLYNIQDSNHKKKLEELAATLFLAQEQRKPVPSLKRHLAIPVKG